MHSNELARFRTLAASKCRSVVNNDAPPELVEARDSSHGRDFGFALSEGFQDPAASRDFFSGTGLERA